MSRLSRRTDLRLARLHLRGGGHALARAELETLAGADRLDREGILDLAEVRWRTGDLGGAAAAAAAWLEEGDEGPGAILAHLIGAEAAAAAGDHAAATGHVAAAAAGLKGWDALEALLAGIAARATWPWEAPTLREAALDDAGAAGGRIATPGPSSADASVRGRPRVAPPASPAATALAQQGAALLAEAPERAAIALALALRADRAAAEVVLAALDDERARRAQVPGAAPDSDATAAAGAGVALLEVAMRGAATLAFVRAEALRAAGRHEEARIAYASAERLALAPAEVGPPGSSQ